MRLTPPEMKLHFWKEIRGSALLTLGRPAGNTRPYIMTQLHAVRVTNNRLQAVTWSRINVKKICSCDDGQLLEKRGCFCLYDL